MRLEDWRHGTGRFGFGFGFLVTRIVKVDEDK